MKTLKLIGLFTAFGLLFTSFISKNSNTSFESAIAEKKIEIVIQPTGSYSGNCINIEVKNLANGKINLEMLAGTIFIPSDTGEQTLITSKDQLLVLNKNEVKTFKVFAYCTEASDRCPSKSSTFKIAKTENVALQKITHFLDSLNSPNDHLIQQSIWCITDNESVSSVYDDDINVSKALRSYLCSVTGQTDPWYKTKREVTVDHNNNIINTAKEIKGEIEFTSTEPVELQGVVVDSLGNIVLKSPNKMSCPAGKIKFEFNLKVAGWKPGTYAVVYTNNEKEMIRQPFSF